MEWWKKSVPILWIAAVVVALGLFIYLFSGIWLFRLLIGMLIILFFLLSGAAILIQTFLNREKRQSLGKYISKIVFSSAYVVTGIIIALAVILFDASGWQ